MPRVRIETTTAARRDELTPVRITGCPSGARVTLVASSARGKSRTTFTATPDGVVDTGTHAPIGETGVEPMAWLWRMETTEETASTPSEIDTSDGQRNADSRRVGTVTLRVVIDGDRQAETTVTRGEHTETDETSVARGQNAETSEIPVTGDSDEGDRTTTRDRPPVVAESVEENDVTGVVLRRDDDRNRPGIVALHGSNGDPAVGPARALATRGFAVFALQWFGGAAPTAGMRNVPVSFITRAASWFGDRSGVREPLGVWGISKGGELATAVGAYTDWPGAVVAVSPSGLVLPAPDGGATVAVDGEPHPTLPTPDEPAADDPVEMTEQLLAVADETDVESARIPVERTDAPLRLFVGGADAVWTADRLTEPIADAVADAPDARRVVYPDAGHAITPPYRPTTEGTKGGTPAANARAARDVWGRTLTAFADALGD